MGHRQQMTNEQRIAWDANSYKLRLEANKGKGTSYLNDNQLQDLMKKGYQYYFFDNGKTDTNFLFSAQDKVKELRSLGNFARIVVNSCYNIRGGQTYSVIWRGKKNK